MEKLNKKVMLKIIGFYLSICLFGFLMVLSVGFTLGWAEEAPLKSEVNLPNTGMKPYVNGYYREVNLPLIETDTIPKLVTTVRATFYNPVASQTDGTPNRTATGFEIDLDNPYKHRIIAVSKDIERMGFGMGDSVNLKFPDGSKASIYDGHYVIQDRMPSQHTRKIDLLVSSDMYMSYLKGVELTKLEY